MAIRAGFGIFYDFPNFSYDQFGFEEPYGGAVISRTGPNGCTTTCLHRTPGAPNPFTFADQQGVSTTGQDPFPDWIMSERDQKTLHTCQMHWSSATRQ